MTTRYPMQFENDATSKKALLIEPPNGYTQDCQNCGGVGQLHAFYKDKGPFQHTPAFEKGQVLKSIPDSFYGWVWYVGKTLALPCPTCDGLGGDKKKRSTKPMTPEQYAKMAVKRPLKDLAKK